MHVVFVGADSSGSAPTEEFFTVSTTNNADDAFRANRNGDFIIDVNEMDGGRNGWTLRNDVSGATGGQALSWNGAQSFGNPSNGQLSYTFHVEESGIYYYGLRTLSEKGPKTEHNDAFLRITRPNGNEIVPEDGFKGGKIHEPSFTGESGNYRDGWFKAYQFGGGVDEWAYSNKNVDTVGIPLAYDLVAGQTYIAQIAARSNLYVIDQIQLALIENPPDITKREPTIAVELPANSPLSERGEGGGGGGGNGSPPSISFVPDQMVFENETVDLNIRATDPDGNNTVDLSFELLRPNGLEVNPNTYTFKDNGNGTADFTWITPDRSFDGTYDAFVFADDGDNPTVQRSFEITVKDDASPEDPPVESGDILFRVNAGGGTVQSEDSGPNWTADTIGNNSPFLIDNGSNTVNTPNVPGTAVLPSDAPSEVFESHRWDRPNGTTMEYGFDVPNDGEYLVRLFMRNVWKGADDPGERLFDVKLEGSVPSAFNDIDPVALFGHRVGGVVEASVEVTDGTLNVEFINNVSNPMVNAIEIVALDDSLAIV